MFRTMLKTMQKEGFLRPEPVAGQYEQLYDQMQILSDFWIASSELLYEGKRSELCDYYVKLSLGLFVPYMSVIGLEKWEEALNQLAPETV